MERAVTRQQMRKTSQPTKMPLASKPVKKEEPDTRPKLAQLDQNCIATRRCDQGLPTKLPIMAKIARGIPANEREKAAAENRRYTRSKVSLTRKASELVKSRTTRQNAGIIQERRGSKVTQKGAESIAHSSKPNSALTCSHDNPVTEKTTHGHQAEPRAAKVVPAMPKRVQEKGCHKQDLHGLLPDNIIDLSSLPQLCTVKELTDPQLCTEYIHDIYQNLLNDETQNIFRIKPDLLSHQTEVEASHRRVLMDWLVQVHTTFSLLPDTLHITIDIIDRYLQLVDISRKEFQLVGITAMFLASKYEEIYPNSISEFTYIAADTYTTEHIRQKEVHILRTLGYQLGKPNPLTFLRRYSKLMSTTMQVHNLAKYFIEVSYMTTECRSLLPSQLAVGALVLASEVTTQDDTTGIWSPLMEQYTWYTHKRASVFAEEVLCYVLNYYQACRRFCAVKDKYTSGFQGVAAYSLLLNRLEQLSRAKKRQ